MAGRARWLQRVTVRTRIAVVAAAAVAVAVALASAAGYVAVRRELLNQADANLRRQGTEILNALVRRGGRPDLGELQVISGVGGPLERSGLSNLVFFQVIQSSSRCACRRTPIKTHPLAAHFVLEIQSKTALRSKQSRPNSLPGRIVRQFLIQDGLGGDHHHAN